MPALIAAARLAPAQAARAAVRAVRLTQAASDRSPSLQAALLDRLALDTPTGLALLSLAEALLRVPDAANADRLIRDQLARLPIAQRGGAARAAGDAALRYLGPLLRSGARGLMRLLGGQFVFAADIDRALARARRGTVGWCYSFDMLGEAALTAADAQRYGDGYAGAIRAVGAADRGHAPLAEHGVSLKLSALHPRFGYAQRARVLRELLPRLSQLAHLAQRWRVALDIDAEESERLELSLELIEALLCDADLAQWPGLGVAVQAYQKRAPAVIEHLSALAARRPHALRVRLVKGAYWDQEIKSTQIEGLSGYPIYTRKPYTDVAYLACARRLLADAHLVPQFATHNARTVAEILELAAGAGASLEFQRLYGMGGALYRQLLRHPQRYGGARVRVRVYAPIGERAALLPYLMRRLLENGAGNSFVHRARHASAPSLTADPVATAARLGGAPHPHIPLPRELFAPARCNSAGLDLQSEQVQSQLAQALEHSRGTRIEAGPMLADDAGGATGTTGACREIRNPADRSELIGTVRDCDAAGLQAALAAAVDGSRSWGGTPIQARAQLLERAAALFEQRAPALIALIVRETGRTLADSIGEVREAVDAMRYYAAQIRAQFDAATHVPLGAVLCISPWNFPLAIFTGQVAAALAAGNAVLAKPAEQSTATAALAVTLLREAGIPPAALQLLPGDGARVGMALAADARVRGVVFTGSTATARAITRTLARRGQVPLIAETGGQNAMIVDSSALPEQVVTDVLRSAFDSAGQRCSSLRVLCLQQEIEAPVLTMLQGAMQELAVGDPAGLATDVGPLIDEEARERIEAHLRVMRTRLLCRSPLPPGCERGVFVAPTLLRIGSIDELSAEVFGPVLHVLSFERRRLFELIDQINATGYGLTLGIASRVTSTIEDIVERARAGNVYVNRNMIGAVIGVQPFGGQGLSGTGPKAGGPLYLHALLQRSPGPPLRAAASGAAGSPVPAGLGQLIGWLQGEGAPLEAQERERLRRAAEGYARRTLLGVRVALPGYAGESNELRLRARGRVRATARTLPGLVEQLAAALATGNVLSVEQRELAESLAALLPAPMRPALLCPPMDVQACQAVLVDAADAAADADWLQRLRIELAAAEGPIVPLLIGQAPEGYRLESLLVEQTLTVNTAAVGGDARLLSLQDDAGD
ncbi:MAG TPA: bifunctional proline dehydrogenase/L-glutamate gamma-semialdehyde dehydrogenase PutA [Steroidobacteraceae bacterium]|nr:bifunctional proline dehydrogenase/L-glutamate gamma-semialdehyde dehydrogenase PutA [Steroidobacteraceae bacterium]